MELSRVADYAIRAVLCLTIKKKPCKTAEVAEAMFIPKAYLSKVFQELAKRDIVRLEAGVGGGVELIRDPADLTLLEVIEAIEGRFALNRCVYAPGECQLVKFCPVHSFWAKAQKVLLENVGNVTFSVLAEQCEVVAKVCNTNVTKSDSKA